MTRALQGWGRPRVMDPDVASGFSVPSMSKTRPFAVRAAGVFGAAEATVVRVAAGLIAAVGGPEVVEAGDLVIDGGRGWLLPGLTDAHVHLGPGTARLAALQGVTTVVDQFSTADLLVEELRRTSLPASGVSASVRVAGVGATAPGGHPSMAYAPIPYVTGPQDADAFVQARVDEGATHLKVIYDDGMGAHMDLTALSEATVRALVAEAHAAGLVVVAHISTAPGAVLMARCGVDVLGHVPFERLSPEQVRELAELGVAVIATLSIVDGFPDHDGRLPLEVDPVLSPRLTPAWAQVLRAQAQRWMPPGGLEVAIPRANVSALHAAGVRILAGTDAPNPGLVVGLSLHRELTQLVNAGLTPTEAITAATSAPGDVFGLSDRGRIQVGARADLLLVAADPTTDVTATGLIEQVWVGGEPVLPAAGDDEAQDAQIRWIATVNTKILAAVHELWPEWAPDRLPEIITLTGVCEVDAVLPALTHPDKNTRQRAAVALGTLADDAAGPALVARLRDEPDFFVRDTVTWAVTRLGETTRELVEALAESQDPVTTSQALHVLSKIASPLSIPTVSRYTGDRDATVAAKARTAIARIGDPAGITVLTEHLGQGGQSEQNQLTTDLASFRRDAVPGVVDLVARCLSDADPQVRRHAADVLAHIGRPAAPAIAGLAQQLTDPDEHVRLAGATALYEIDPPGRTILSRYAGDDQRLRALARRAAQR